METIMYAYIPSYLFSSANGYHPYDQLERKKKKKNLSYYPAQSLPFTAHLRF